MEMPLRIKSSHARILYGIALAVILISTPFAFILLFVITNGRNLFSFTGALIILPIILLSTAFVLAPKSLNTSFTVASPALLLAAMYLIFLFPIILRGIQ